VKDQIAIALERLDLAIARHKPIAVFGLFSGGHDSFSATYIASQHPAFTAAVHINTGIGIAATREYVRETCRDRGWKLLEYAAADNVTAKGEPDPQIYRDLVIRDGFPGPAGHRWMYARLKERQLRRLQREYGATIRKKGQERRVLYVSGCRSQESERRMATTNEVQLDGPRIWCAPIHDWSKFDTSECLRYAGQPRNQVVDLIHKSGECLCGAFAKKSELAELGSWAITREAYREIVALEALVVPIHGRGWGERPQRGGKHQMRLPGMLCWSCDKTAEGSA
jgi:3'-phosphoadenosine 5'-phosphosulfate sulfotransferase (PAPS reductase)/FAD synthetase